MGWPKHRYDWVKNDPFFNSFTTEGRQEQRVQRAGVGHLEVETARPRREENVPMTLVRNENERLRLNRMNRMMPSKNYLHPVKSGIIYDAHKQFKRPGDIGKGYVRAGFELTDNDTRASFAVNGKPCTPVLRGKEGWEVYPLGNGKYMIPQPTLYTCTHACEMMLLLERGKITLDELREALPHGSSLAERREAEDLPKILKKRPHCPPIEITTTLDQDGNNGPFIDQLREGLSKHNTCILSFGAHARMLDKIEEEDGAILFTLRDPMTGTCDRIAVTGNDNFWKRQDDLPVSMAVQCFCLEPGAGTRNRSWRTTTHRLERTCAYERVNHDKTASL